jgi:3-hydroxybutyryl-CoA dehydrogenase
MKSADEIRTCAVLGAGTMGAGIAQVVCAGRHPTCVLCDISTSSATSKGHGAHYRALLAQGRGTRARPPKSSAIDTCPRAAEHVDRACGVPVDRCDLVDRGRARRSSSSSARSLRPSARERQRGLPARQQHVERCRSAKVVRRRCRSPERCIGMHFFNPVPIMAAARDRQGPTAASDAVLERVRSYAVQLRQGADRRPRQPGLRHVAPGRLPRPRGDPHGRSRGRVAEDIDKAMELGYRHPMGPLRS